MREQEANVEISSEVRSRDEIDSWLDSHCQPDIEWQAEGKYDQRISNFNSLFAYQLRARYIEFWSDFRTILPRHIEQEQPDFASCSQIIHLLDLAKNMLNSDEPNLLEISIILDQVERYMIWIYPIGFAEIKIKNLKSRLIDLNIEYKDNYISDLDDFAGNDQAIKNGLYRPIFDELIRIISNKMLKERINNGLQIARLETLRNWGIVLFISIMILSPIITNPQIDASFPIFDIDSIVPFSSWLHTWLIAICITLIGAMGGYLSGLFKSRVSETSLIKFEEDMLKLQLRLLIGAFVSLILFLLLSWSILPGLISNVNIGSYILVAFLSGFTERYFLDLLEIEINENQIRKQGSNYK